MFRISQLFVQKRLLEELEQIAVCGEGFGPELHISPHNEPWFVKLTFCCDFQIQTNLCKFLPDRVNKKIYTCRGESRMLLVVLSVPVEIRDGFYLLCYMPPAFVGTSSSAALHDFFPTSMRTMRCKKSLRKGGSKDWGHFSSNCLIIGDWFPLSHYLPGRERGRQMWFSWKELSPGRMCRGTRGVVPCSRPVICFTPALIFPHDR